MITDLLKCPLFVENPIFFYCSVAIPTKIKFRNFNLNPKGVVKMTDLNQQPWTEVNLN